MPLVDSLSFSRLPIFRCDVVVVVIVLRGRRGEKWPDWEAFGRKEEMCELQQQKEWRRQFTGCTDGDMRPPRAENGVEGDGGVPILSLSAAVAQNDAAAMETPT